MYLCMSGILFIFLLILTLSLFWAFLNLILLFTAPSFFQSPLFFLIAHLIPFQLYCLAAISPTVSCILLLSTSVHATCSTNPPLLHLFLPLSQFFFNLLSYILRTWHLFLSCPCMWKRGGSGQEPCWSPYYHPWFIFNALNYGYPSPSFPPWVLHIWQWHITVYWWAKVTGHAQKAFEKRQMVYRGHIILKIM